VRPEDAAAAAVLTKTPRPGALLARMGTLTVDPGRNPAKASARRGRGSELFVPLPGAVEFDAELARPGQGHRQDRQGAHGVEDARQPGFVNNAPADVVDKERAKAQAMRDE
jgi:valyl-tRNA synthetase